ncbi:DNA-binding response regulator [Vibrio sinensis]|uniref:DNA-binding response regulator n=1 Tax=Vibrio sinensis TaxID=2302434 RepID=A0A3A6QQU8_9VIBR|nr:response regulator transcription factor [Vibrio sinensis]RJX75310.1 DNA-binding response regulator [Vibrio sinensis]
MKIIEKVVVFFGEQNIHNRLVVDQLREIEEIELFFQSPKDVILTSQITDVDIILLDFHCINDSAFRDVLNGRSIQFDLILYNIPQDTSEQILMQISNLKGILFNDSPIEHLVKSVEHVLRGDMWLPRKLMVAMLQRFFDHSVPIGTNMGLLTRRERQILDRLANGQSNQQIADGLYVAESTVKTHVYKLYKKINVRCRKEAISLVNQLQNKQRQATELLESTLDE